MNRDIDDWQPEVGELVEYVDNEPSLRENGFDNLPAIYVATYEGKYILAFDDMSGGVVASRIRPIQIDEKRQEQIRYLEDAICRVGVFTIEMQARMLYEKGCRVLSDDEYIVKPLTDEQKADVRRGTYMSDYDIDAVQRELGVEV